MSMFWREDGNQKTGVRRKKKRIKDKGQRIKAEDRRQKSQIRSQESGDRRQKSPAFCPKNIALSSNQRGIAEGVLSANENFFTHDS